MNKGRGSILLNERQYTILKYCYSGAKSYKEISNKLKVSEQELNRILTSDFLNYFSPVWKQDGKTRYGIKANEPGKAIIDARKKDDRHFRIPVIVSIAAIVISFIALIVSIVK